VQLPADKTDLYTISDRVVRVCREGPVKPIVLDDEANPTDELKGKIDL
jgi:hypothetical protein